MISDAEKRYLLTHIAEMVAERERIKEEIGKKLAQLEECIREDPYSLVVDLDYMGKEDMGILKEFLKNKPDLANLLKEVLKKACRGNHIESLEL